MPHLSFAMYQNYNAGGQAPGSVQIADLNGDGKLDLVAGNDPAKVSVLLGQGDGTFHLLQPDTTVGHDGPEISAVVDLNGDGKLDLVVPTAADSNVSVLLGNGNGTFKPHQDIHTSIGDPRGAVVADFNGDGRFDIAIPDSVMGKIIVVLGKGDGTFQQPEREGAIVPPGFDGGLAMGDLNRDGKMDLVAANRKNNSILVLLGNGDGTFQPQRVITVSNASAENDAGDCGVGMAIVDLDGDGTSDLAIADGNTNKVVVMLGNGDGTFKAGSSFRVGSCALSVAIGDLNSDGKPDIAISNNSSSFVSVLLGDGTGHFLDAQNNISIGTDNLYNIRIGDLNGDGRPDLVVANDNAPPMGALSVLINESP